MQLGIAIGVQRPLTMSLTILRHPQSQPPAPLIRLLSQQLDVELGRLGRLAQLLG